METLSRRIRFGYGIGDLGGNLFFTIVGFYLLYYLTDVVNLSAALAGTVLMIGKIWDAVTDPVTGYLSDRTRTRWGRRRPYILVGAVISFIAMILMFTRPNLTGQGSLFLLLTFYFCLLNTAYTLVNIPYTALLPELTRDFDQRTLLTGYRMSFAVIGTFVGAGAVMPIIGLFSSEERGWSAVGGIMGGIMLASALVTVWAVREPKQLKPSGGPGFFKTYLEVLGLSVFLRAMIPWALFITGTTMIQGALVYYFKYILLDEGLFQTALLFLLSFSLLCIPVWVAVSKRIGKKTSYSLGMGLMSLAVVLFSLFAQKLGSGFAFFMMAVGGIGLSTHYVMPYSILPDVVEYDAVRNGGIRREGAFSSLWTFSSKIGQAAALAVSGWILELFKYSPDVIPSRLTLTGIKLLCGPLPVVFYTAGIIILSSYPISRAYYDRMISVGIPAGE
jgi:glycoside/pentoside/hexuronide:cation symporter, GPH family